MKQRAVALGYTKFDKRGAPRVLASGEGFLATQICQIAQKHEIEFISDPLLVDSLSQVPVGTEIPKELYDTVAILFRYLLSSDKKKNN